MSSTTATESKNPQVLIVGAGPVGLSLAHFLHLSDISFRIVEKRTSVSSYSRAFAVQSRTLEILNLMNVVDSMVEKGRKLDNIEFNAYSEGSTLFQLRMPKPNSSQAYIVGVMQSETEKILEAKLNELGHFVERNKELVDVEFVNQIAKSATVKDLSDNSEEKVEFQYIVGCDGARSIVRKKSGIKFDGETVNLNLVCCDARLVTDIPTIQFGNFFFKGDIGSGIINVKDDVVRLILPLRENEIEPSEQELILKFKDIVSPYQFEVTEVLWFNTFKINERSASTHLQNNVILCGDAAHVHSPAGGQGMNTGIQDAFNLSWKLSLQLKGLTKDNALLETFNSERKDIAKLVLANSGRMIRTVMGKPSFTTKLLRGYLAPLLFKFEYITQKMSNAISEVNLEYNTNIVNVKNEIDWTCSMKLNGVGLRIPYMQLYDLNNQIESDTHKFFDGNYKFQILLVIPTAALHLDYLYSTIQQFDQHPALKKVCDLRIILPTPSFSWFGWFDKLNEGVSGMNKLKIDKLKLLLTTYNSYLDQKGELVEYFNLYKGTLSGVVVRPDFHTCKVFDGGLEIDNLVDYFNRFLKL